MDVKTVVLPVGGFGTRFLPATKSMPKEMLPIITKPLIHYAFEEARAAGIERFIFITGRNKTPINDYFDIAYEVEGRLKQQVKNEELEEVSGWLPEAGNISFIRQSEPRGLGHAIWCARNFINGPFAVILADELFLEENPGTVLKSMISDFKNSGCGGVIGTFEVEKNDVSKYGIVKTDGNQGSTGEILDIVEKPSPQNAPSRLAVVGRYIFDKEIFNHISLSDPGALGEIQITDAIARMNQDNRFRYRKVDCMRFDCGSVNGYLDATVAFALHDPKLKNHMESLIRKYSQPK